MGDHDYCFAFLLPESVENLDDFSSGDAVKRSCRLVCKDNFWIAGKGPCNLDPLLLPSRELGWFIMHFIRKPYKR